MEVQNHFGRIEGQGINNKKCKNVYGLTTSLYAIMNFKFILVYFTIYIFYFYYQFSFPSFSVYSQALSDVIETEEPSEHSLVKRQIDERRVVCYYANWAVYRYDFFGNLKNQKYCFFSNFSCRFLNSKATYTIKSPILEKIKIGWVL